MMALEAVAGVRAPGRQEEQPAMSGSCGQATASHGGGDRDVGAHSVVALIAGRETQAAGGCFRGGG
jgi:hypothetical protein